MLDFKLKNEKKQTFNYIRILGDSDDDIKITNDNKCIYVKDQPKITFNGQYVFYKENQNVVCDTILSGVVEAGLEGISCLILAYGEGGSGKSQTCFGTRGSRDQCGISYRLIERLFETKKNMDGRNEIVIELGFLEFTLTNTIDLLLYKKYERPKYSHFTLVETSSEGKDLVYFGEKMRHTIKLENRKAHKYSAILAIRLTCKSLNRSKPIFTKATILIADLAALELSCHKIKSNDYDYSKNTRDNFVGNITMMQISHLLHKRHKHNPCIFRSPIVRYLNAALPPYSITKFLGHSSGSVSKRNMLKSVIRIANRFAMHKFTEIQGNTEIDTSLYIEKQQTEIKRLKHVIELNAWGQIEAMFPKEDKSREQIQILIEDFLQDGENNVDVHFNQVNEYFEIFKEVISELKAENTKLQLELVTALIRSTDDISNRIKSTNDDIPIKSNNKKTKSDGTSLEQSKKSDSIRNSVELVGELALGGISIGPDQTQVLNKSVSMKNARNRIKQTSVFYRRSKKTEDPVEEDITRHRTILSQENSNIAINKFQKDYLAMCTLLKQAHSNINTLKYQSEVDTEMRATVLKQHLHVILELEQKVSDLRQTILYIQEHLDQCFEFSHQEALFDNIHTDTHKPDHQDNV